MRKLQENPEDEQAHEQMSKAQQQLAQWNGGGARKFLSLSADQKTTFTHF